MAGTAGNGIPWAVDNDAFHGFDESGYLEVIKSARGKPGCLFVTVPDVVGDAEATLALFEQWYPRLVEFGLPLALVGQDGLQEEDVPWHKISAFFVGGTTEWKLGPKAAALVRRAKELGKWVHMGRVNTNGRILYASQLGCDSIDGSSYGRFPKKYLPSAIEILNQLNRQKLQKPAARAHEL